TVKIIKRDFPLIGYRSVASIKPKNDSWFFLMKTPLEKYKIKSKREWLQHVFGRTGKTSSDISKLYVQHYEKRGIHSNQSDMRKFRKNFERVAKKRFEF
ncbi:MAG: hypothetical protein KGL95_07110, partial [Patescibacteria group bacterium]|nr:hypothetical protein [Patescibacteria group bacterium]